MARWKSATSPWIVLIAVQLGNLVSSIDSAMVSVALPEITRALDAQISEAQWIISSYFLASAVFVMLAGRLGDHFGSSRIFMGGFALVALAALGSAASHNFVFLISCRVIQGVGAAALLANGNAILTKTFQDKGRGLALGLNSTVLAAGLGFGYVIGGVLVDAGGWRLILLVTTAVSVLAFCISWRILPWSEPGNSRRFVFDRRGMLLISVLVPCLLLGLARISETKDISPSAVFLLILSISAAALLPLAERRAAMPLLPPKLMSRPAVAVGLASIFLFSAFLATTGLLLPILLQNVLAHSASQTGLILSAYSMTMCILAPISGHLADRYCASCMMVAGAGLAALVATTYAVAGDSLPLRGFALGQLAVGLAAGLFYAPNRVLMFDGLEDGAGGSVSAAMQLTRQMTYAIATSISSFYLAVSGLSLTDAITRVFWANAVLLVAACVITLSYIKYSKYRAQGHE